MAADNPAYSEANVWYHSIDLGGGVVSPGYFDLRPIVERLPWPDVRGKRCLDVGTYDGFYAFELERRGAREVVAVDVPDPSGWDWPPDAAEHGPALVEEFTRQSHAKGFDIAHRALGSSVEKHAITVYELDPDELGTFDVVTCGSLLLHLRDPVRALEAIRSVCSGSFLSVDEIRLSLSTPFDREPLAELNGSGEAVQWWVPNASGHRQMLHSAGFSVTRAVGPFPIPLGSSHPASDHRGRRWRGLGQRLTQRLLAGGAGVPHQALLAAPRV